MAWTFTAFTGVVLAGAIVALVVGVVALRERPDPLAMPLALLMFAVAAWAIPHAISFGYTDLETVSLWHRVRYFGTGVAPLLYLVFAFKYAGYERWLSRRIYAGLAVVPAITVLVVWSNPYHGLFWRSLSVAQVYGASVLVPTHGPWYWINLAYLYLVTLLGLGVFAWVVLRAGSIYRKQSVLMFVAGAIPLVVNVVVNFGPVMDPPIDFTTTALAVTGVLFAVTLYRLDLLDIRPIAYDRLVEVLDDGIVIVGPEGRIHDFNPTAERVLEGLQIDRLAEEVFPSQVTADGGEIVATIGGEDRFFRSRSTTLTDERGRDIGRIVYLNDVTELAEREQRISVLNRILRHNIRNELTVISGRLDLLEEHVPEDERESVEMAGESARRVIELAEKARYIEQTLQDGDRSEPVSAVTIVDRIVADARERYPDAVIERELGGSGAEAKVAVLDERLFEISLAELVENAVMHNDRTPAQVAVRVASGEGQTRVSVVDNGPEIPTQETKPLAAKRETPLEHTTGLGLWLVKWFSSLSNGELTFEENDPRGNVVTLRLPSADD